MLKALNEKQKRVVYGVAAACLAFLTTRLSPFRRGRTSSTRPTIP